VAAALGAEVCEIYTDVDGVYTTDPNLVPGARKLGRISFDEMLEMASLGAKVLQIRSVKFAKQYGVPIHVRSSFSDVEGTWVTREEDVMERLVVSGVTYNRNEAKIRIRGVKDQPGAAARLFSPLGESGIVVDMIIQNLGSDGSTDMTFTVPKSDYRRALAIAQDAAREIGASAVEGDEGIAKVSIVGLGMKDHAGVASRMFRVLADEGINIQLISTSEIKISVVIDEKYTELAVRALHVLLHALIPALRLSARRRTGSVRWHESATQGVRSVSEPPGAGGWVLRAWPPCGRPRPGLDRVSGYYPPVRGLVCLRLPLTARFSRNDTRNRFTFVRGSLASGYSCGLAPR